MPRFASCVQNGASRTIFPAALFIVVGMADRSAARIPSRQALLQQAVVPVAQQEVVAAAEAPGAQREVVAAAAAEAPGAQREVAAVAVVPVAQQEEEVVVVVATVPASQQEVVVAAAPAAPREAVVPVGPAAVLEPPVVLTQALVQAVLPAPAIAGSVRCREMAAAVASAPPAMAMPRAVAAHCRSGSAMDLGRASSRPARSRLASSGWLSASAAAVDLRSHRAAAVRFVCPGWASRRRPVTGEPAAMPERPASEKTRSKAWSEMLRATLAWRLQATDLRRLVPACRRQLAEPPVARPVACG